MFLQSLRRLGWAAAAAVLTVSVTSYAEDVHVPPGFVNATPADAGAFVPPGFVNATPADAGAFVPPGFVNATTDDPLPSFFAPPPSAPDAGLTTDLADPNPWTPPSVVPPTCFPPPVDTVIPTIILPGFEIWGQHGTTPGHVQGGIPQLCAFEGNWLSWDGHVIQNYSCAFGFNQASVAIHLNQGNLVTADVSYGTYIELEQGTVGVNYTCSVDREAGTITLGVDHSLLSGCVSTSCTLGNGVTLRCSVSGETYSCSGSIGIQGRAVTFDFQASATGTLGTLIVPIQLHQTIYLPSNQDLLDLVPPLPRPYLYADPELSGIGIEFRR